VSEHKSAEKIAKDKDAACAPAEPRVTLINAGPYVIKVEAHDSPSYSYYQLSLLGLGLPGLSAHLTEAQANQLIEALS
jgi:hypothetical protein